MTRRKRVVRRRGSTAGARTEKRRNPKVQQGATWGQSFRTWWLFGPTKKRRRTGQTGWWG